MSVKKYIKRGMILFLAFFLLFTTNISNANEKEEVDQLFLNSIYTNEYIEYLKLSDEEKEKIHAIPRKYKYSFDEYYNDKIKEDVNNYNMVGGEIKLPSYYNLRDKIEIKAENQGSYGLCWSFTTSTALETYLSLRNKDYDFSEMHVNYLTSNEFYEYFNEKPDIFFNRKLDTGGTIYQYARYIALGKGPVYEKIVPYVDYDKDQYEFLKNIPSLIGGYNLKEFPYISGYDKEEHKYTDEEMLMYRNDVKNHIMNYGSLYASNSSADIRFSDKSNVYVCNANGTNRLPDHAVSIVGWDDNFSKENFPEEARPENNGAYIALNSWGDYWGDNRIFLHII